MNTPEQGATEQEDLRQFTTQAPLESVERAAERESQAFQAVVADQRSDAKPEPFSGGTSFANPTSDREDILRYFKYEHLPINLQMISAPFSLLALNTIMKLPRSAERSTALRKLLESKDAAVRAALPPE